MVDDLETYNRRTARARLFIEDDDEFVEDVILDRDASMYPDPYFRDENDAAFLKLYMERIETAVQNYTPQNDEEQELIREYVTMERQRVHSRRAQILFPSPSTHGLEPGFVRDVKKSNSVPKSRQFIVHANTDWDVWKQVFSLSIDELRYLSAYFRVHSNFETETTDTEAFLIDAFRFVKGDETVSVTHLFEWETVDEWAEYHCVFDEDGNEVDKEFSEGVSFDVVKQELEELLFDSHNFLFGMAIGQVSKISNVVYDGSANGLYKDSALNFASDLDSDEFDAVMPRSLVGHEFFHAVQDVLGAFDVNADWCDMELGPSEWEPVMLVERFDNDVLTGIQDDMVSEWFRLRAGEYEGLCEYQYRNLHECFAVAFECWLTAPETLREEQPGIYDVINRVMTF